MVWLAKKAFFGHVPFPVMHVDTGKKFRAMYEFRDRYAKEWKLNLIVEDCPPYEATDPTLPVNARWGQRKTLGLRAAIAKHGFTGIIAGIRRDEEATRAKERVFSPRGDAGQWDFKDQPPEFWDQFNTDLPKGTHLRVHPLLHWTEIDIWHYIRREGIPVIDLYFAPGPRRPRQRQARQALPLARRRGHHLPDRQQCHDARRGHHRARNDEDVGARRPRHGPRDRGRLRAAARRRLHVMPRSEVRAGGRARPAAHRHRRPCRPRQVDPGRPPHPRHGLAARGQARGHQGDVRAARHALRMGLPHGCLPGRARPGHHHRHRADLAAHAARATTSSSTRPATASSSRT